MEACASQQRREWGEAGIELNLYYTRHGGPVLTIDRHSTYTLESFSRNELLCGRRARVPWPSGHVHAALHIPLST